MKHSDIAIAAIAAAIAAHGNTPIAPYDPSLRRLYGYARERKFPNAEVLARKYGELIGQPFPHKSLAEASETRRAFFIALRATAEALEPLHEDDPEGYEHEIDQKHAFWMAMEPNEPAPPPGDGHDCLELLRGEGWLVIPKGEDQDFQQVFVVFDQIDNGPGLLFSDVLDVDGRSINVGQWRDPAEQGGPTLALIIHKSQIRRQEKPAPDSIEARTATAQADMDAVIAANQFAPVDRHDRLLPVENSITGAKSMMSANDFVRQNGRTRRRGQADAQEKRK